MDTSKDRKWRGNPVVYNKRQHSWVYESDGCKVKDDKDRKCGHCGRKNTPAGHDGCIPDLPGVINACCGHGDRAGSYVMFADGRVMRYLALETSGFSRRKTRLREAQERATMWV